MLGMNNDILRAHQISTAVIDIIEEARDYCFLVTPYLKSWPLLDRALEKAAQRRIKLTLIVRKDSDSFPKLEPYLAKMNEYGFEVVALVSLHTKLYLNEKRALVTSMNLYDGSKERNYELGVMLQGLNRVRRLKNEIVDGDLLAAEPALRMDGWFRQEKAPVSAERFDTGIGYCVICGTQMDMDMAGYIVRCTSCWGADKDAPRNLAIRVCHLCGKPHASTLNDPSHVECSTALGRRVMKDQFGL